MTPFFSIIIPVYNVAPYLRECLDSVLAQTFTEWEAICVDDGSTDGCGAILDEYKAKDERFHIIHQNNAGVGAARNAALDVAKGEWVLFLDGDDVWNGTLLSIVAGMIAKWPNEKLFRFSFERFEGGFWQSMKKDCYVEDATFIDISQEISMRDFGFFFFCCYAYHKDLLAGIRFPRYIRGEDRCVFTRILLERVDSFVATNAMLYGYRKREGSAMNRRPSLQVLCDEMDHRLDIMEMIDVSGRRVDYAGDYWLEGYFTHRLPSLVLDRPDDARAVRKEWRRRLPRFMKCRGLSKRGRMLLRLSSSFLLRPVGDLLVFSLPYLRSKVPMLRPVARLYRRIMLHGEYAK